MPTSAQSREQYETLQKFNFRIVLLALVCLARNVYAASDKDRNALEKTSEAIRAAFARGDVSAAMEYHHPDVIKALVFHKQLKGCDAVAADLRGTLQQFNVQFVKNQVESLLIEGNTAVEQTLFAIKSTPKEEANRLPDIMEIIDGEILTREDERDKGIAVLLVLLAILGQGCFWVRCAPSNSRSFWNCQAFIAG